MANGVRLILASASPRRRQLLDEAGYGFEVDPSGVDEDRLAQGCPPKSLPQFLAEAKADDVAARHARQPVVILAADTVAYTSTGEVLGKPRHRADAERMLRALVGTVHHVVTGYCCIRVDDNRRLAGRVRSDVTMRAVSDVELNAYLDTGLWKGKAGAYGIQDEPGGAEGGGGGDLFIESIGGELTNIIGLPMPQIVDALDTLGVTRDVA